MTNTDSNLKLAIIGMACRFPDANSPDEFWSNIVAGKESIRSLTDEELRSAGVSEELLRLPNYIKFGSVPRDIATFDARFFEINPREAEVMDPQHRFLLMCCWEALEAAGYSPREYGGSIGLFAGAGRNTYFRNNLCPPPGSIDGVDGSVRGLQLEIGNYGDFFTTRVSFKLNLRGPSINIQTACSTSLVAVHLACQSLLTGESDMALAGGVSITVPNASGYLYEEGAISSPDGHCRAFDQSGQGTLFGSGAGIVLIKRLDDAIRDRDTIHAVVRATAINNDGSRKISFSAPSVDGQADIIAQAMSLAGVDAESVSYVEAHGTGTRLGDPIEIAALSKAFGLKTERPKSCAIGTVKTNFGHLGAAAGIAGLIKTTLALRNKQIPPSLNFNTPNPEINFEQSPFYVNTALQDWNTDSIRRAGVSSFGIGGTNAHAILEEYTAPREERKLLGKPLVVPISAKSETALHRIASSLLAKLNEPHALDEIGLEDLSFTLCQGREDFEHRFACVSSSIEELRGQLRQPIETLSAAQPPQIVFMFSGQGSQFFGMGKELYTRFDVFKKSIDQCCEILFEETGKDFRSILFSDQNHTALHATENTQPALFIVQYALSRLLAEFGVVPDLLIGHSVGEYAAACIAGVFDLNTALKLVVARGRIMQSAPIGAMTAVFASQSQCPVPDTLSIASINSNSELVVAGDVMAIEEFEKELAERECSFKRLNTSHAFHSHLMDHAAKQFQELVSSVQLQAPKIPIQSCFTTPSATKVDDHSYWSRQLREAVDFNRGIESLLNAPNRLFIEIGPGSILANLTRQNSGYNGQPALTTIIRNQAEDDGRHFLALIATLHTKGSHIRFSPMFNGYTAKRIELPTYPFEGEHYWIDAIKSDAYSAQRPLEERRSKPRDNENNYLKAPQWIKSEYSSNKNDSIGETVLVYCRPNVDSDVRKMFRTSSKIITVFPGEGFEQLSDNQFQIVPGDEESTLKLFERLSALQVRIDIFLHLWFVDESAVEGEIEKRYQRNFDLGFYSLLFAAKAFGSHSKCIGLNLRFLVLTLAAQDVQTGDLLCPEGAAVLGPCKVIPEEFPGICTKSIDIHRDVLASTKLYEIIRNEINADFTDDCIAYRNGNRFVKRFVSVTDKEEVPTVGKTALVTGGLGGLGLKAAETLKDLGAQKIVLIGRSPFPAKSDWSATLLDPRSSPELRQQIETIQKLKSKDVEIIIRKVDVCDFQDLSVLVHSEGPFDTIVHTAGIAGGGIIYGKTKESAAKVLAPKVAGLVYLNSLCPTCKLFVNFSSMSSIIGGFGQVDYAAANAFLDAFSTWASSAGKRMISISWDRWAEVGMAVKVGQKFEHRSLSSSDSPSAEFRLDPTSSWLFQEHKVDGIGLLPGTAYIEFIHRTFKGENTKVTIEELLFLRPLFAPSTEPVCIQVQSSMAEHGIFEVAVQSVADKEVTVHATARVSITSASETQIRESFEELRKRFSLNPGKGSKNQTDSLKSSLLSFGKRWDAFGNVIYVDDECLAEIELPEEYRNDLGDHPLHPALLDCATGAFVSQSANGTQFLPFSYKRIDINGPLPSKCYSHIRRALYADTDENALNFDISIFDPEGSIVATFEGYHLRSVNKESWTPPGDEQLQVGSPGDLQTLRYSKITTLPPLEDEVQITVAATGLNFKEVLIALGMLPLAGVESHCFGLECSGVVAAVGAAVSSYKRGDRVMALATGAFGSKVNVAQKWVSLIPESMSFEEAATLPVAYTTAFHALVKLGNLKRGEKVLIHAAAGGVGLAAVKVAQSIGAEIFGTAGSDRKRSYLKGIGVHHVLDSRSTRFSEEIFTLTGGEGVDLVLNSLSGEYIEHGLNSLKPGGRFVEIGKRDILEGTKISLRPFERGISYISLSPNTEATGFLGTWIDLEGYFRSGAFPPLPYEAFEKEKVCDAFDHMMKARHIGKVILSRDSKHAFSAKLPVAQRTIAPSQGQRDFRRILGLRYPHLLVELNDYSGRTNVTSADAFVERGSNSGSSTYSRPKTAGEYVEPVTTVEVGVATAWQSLLGIKPIGKRDNFVAFGGDSLLATQVIARLKRELGVAIPVGALFESGDLEDFSARIEERLVSTPSQMLVSHVSQVKDEGFI